MGGVKRELIDLNSGMSWRAGWCRGGGEGGGAQVGGWGRRAKEVQL